MRKRLSRKVGINQPPFSEKRMKQGARDKKAQKPSAALRWCVILMTVERPHL